MSWTCVLKFETIYTIHQYNSTMRWFMMIHNMSACSQIWIQPKPNTRPVSSVYLSSQGTSCQQVPTLNHVHKLKSHQQLVVVSGRVPHLPCPCHPYWSSQSWSCPTLEASMDSSFVRCSDASPVVLAKPASQYQYHGNWTVILRRNRNKKLNMY